MKHWFIERSPRLGEKAIQTKLHYIKGAIKLICRTSVVQQSAVSPHQGYRQLLEQSLDGCPFFLPILAGKSTSQFPNLNYGTLVPGTQALFEFVFICVCLPWHRFIVFVFVCLPYHIDRGSLIDLLYFVDCTVHLMVSQLVNSYKLSAN